MNIPNPNNQNNNVKWSSNYCNHNNNHNGEYFNNYNSNWGKYTRYQYWNYKRKKNNNKYSAGILPYTYDLNGNCLILLGKDNDGFWSDFGGKCEMNDNFNEKYTAAREFYEESLGSIVSIQECIEKINSNESRIISKTLNGSPYYMYLVYIDFYNYNEIFLKTSNFMRYHFINEKHQINKIIEKNTIRWFNIEYILNYLSNGNNQLFPLRNVFLNTLQISKEQLLYIIK